MLRIAQLVAQGTGIPAQTSRHGPCDAPSIQFAAFRGFPPNIKKYWASPLEFICDGFAWDPSLLFCVPRVPASSRTPLGMAFAHTVPCPGALPLSHLLELTPLIFHFRSIHFSRMPSPFLYELCPQAWSGLVFPSSNHQF